ncbi:MAG: PspC domain-containing protein [Actinomycetota bacterium]
MPAVLGLQRAPERGVISGVAVGIAARTGLDPLIVRLIFVVLTLFGGSGIVIYAGLHLLLPDRAGRGAESSTIRSIVLAGLAIGASAAIRALGLVPFSGVSIPVAVALIGGAVLWREVRGPQTEERPPVAEVMRRLVGDTGEAMSDRQRRVRTVRLVVGVSLVIVAAVAFVAVNGSIEDVGPAVGSMAILIIGLALLAAPWLWRLASDLSAERTARIRSDERAEMAAHLHDSVLQTLTLIQRHPDRADDVARLARRQERELRAWLLDPERPLRGRLSDVLRRAADQVEDDQGVTVEMVSVGDVPIDESMSMLAAAAAEAMRNAARHAGVDEISVYVEVDAAHIEVFVRDRGIGFDPDAVDDDRHGISDSIIGRMQRVGGSATIRSTPGSGTEVSLRVAAPVVEEEQP